MVAISEDTIGGTLVPLALLVNALRSSATAVSTRSSHSARAGGAGAGGEAAVGALELAAGAAGATTLRGRLPAIAWIAELKRATQVSDGTPGNDDTALTQLDAEGATMGADATGGGAALTGLSNPALIHNANGPPVSSAKNSEGFLLGTMVYPQLSGPDLAAILCNAPVALRSCWCPPRQREGHHRINRQLYPDHPLTGNGHFCGLGVVGRRDEEVTISTLSAN
jgi:hypothetical protein